MKKIIMLTLVFMACIVGCEKKGNIVDNSVVDTLDLEKYLGTWYEIARYENRFQKELVGVTAEYSMREDGLIKVLNRGYKKTLDGKHEEAEGKARRPNDAEPGKLEVAFFLSFFGDYYVMELDQENYSYSLVGSSTDKYLWILSRTPQMEPEVLNMLLDNLKKRGYDIDKLIYTPQKEE